MSTRKKTKFFIPTFTGFFISRQSTNSIGHVVCKVCKKHEEVTVIARTLAVKRYKLHKEVLINSVPHFCMNYLSQNCMRMFRLKDVIEKFGTKSN